MTLCRDCPRPLRPRAGSHGPQPVTHPECSRLRSAVAQLEAALAAAPRLRPEVWVELSGRMRACANGQRVPGQRRCLKCGRWRAKPKPLAKLVERGEPCGGCERPLPNNIKNRMRRKR